MQHTKKDCKFDPKIKVVGKILLHIKHQVKVSFARPKEIHDEKCNSRYITNQIISYGHENEIQLNMDIVQRRRYDML